MLRIEKVSREFIDGDETIKALDGISYTFPKTGFFAIVGPSGSGKTTLINILCGLDKPTSGEVFFDGMNVLEQTEEWWDDYRNTKIGIVFQDFQLFEEKTAFENAAFVLSIQDIDVETADQQAKEMLNFVGLDPASNKKVIKLSGGQKQRVAIARTVAKNPDILLADEPTGNLDEENSRRIFKLLREASKHRLVLVVSHDKELCREYSDTILTLRNGRIVSEEVIERSVIKFNGKLCKDNTAQERPDDSREQMSTETIGFLAGESRVPKPLDMKLRYRLVLESFLRQKAKLVIAMLMLIIISTMICFIFLLSYSDDAKSVNRYVSRKNIHTLPLKILLSEHEQMIGEKEYLTYGKSTLEYYSNVIKSGSIIPCNDKLVSVRRVKEWYSDLPKEELTDEHFMMKPVADVACYQVQQEDFSHMEIEGMLPAGEHELLMSSALFEKCGASMDELPYYCEIDSESYYVVGIVNKAYGMEMIEEIQDHYLDRNVISGMVNAIWVLENTSPKAYPPTQVFGIDAISARGLYDYLNNAFYICPISCVETPLSIGRKPNAINEILLSEEYLEKHELHIEDLIDKEYRLKDLYSENYGKAFWDRPNITDFAGPSLKVVGLSPITEQRGVRADCIVSDELYNEITNWFFEYQYKGSPVYCDEDLTLHSFRNLWDKGIRFDIESLNGFYDYCKERDALRQPLMIISGVLIGVLLLMLVYVFSYRISDDKKRIALLRSIGVRKKDINKLYMLEAMLVTTVVLFFSIGSAMLCCNIANRRFCNEYMNGVHIQAISVRPLVLAALVTAFIAIVFLAVSIPLRKLQKKKPMDIFKAV